MSPDDLKSDREKFLDHIYSVFDEASNENEDTLQEALGHFGIDADQLVNEGLSMVLKLKNKQKLAQSRSMLNQLKIAITEARTSASRSVVELRESIASTLANQDSGVAYETYFRKLEAISEHDMESLADDALTIEIWNKISASVEDSEE